jgi:hypothetical protein
MLSTVCQFCVVAGSAKEVRMLYVARLHNGTGTRVRAHDEARLEAGWVQCMRHATPPQTARRKPPSSAKKFARRPRTLLLSTVSRRPPRDSCTLTIMSKFLWNKRPPPPPGEEAPPPPVEDCLECKLVGSGTMFALSGYFVYLNHTATKPNMSSPRLNFVMTACFAAAGFARLFV